MAVEFKGIFAPLTTPFEGETVAVEKFRENIQKYNTTGLSGYVVLGSSGEGVYLTDQESEALVRAAKDAASPEKLLIVGTARESTKLTLEFTNRMADLGVDGSLIRTPSYFTGKMDHEALKKHYLTIADSSKLPLIVYSIPRNTGVTIDAKLAVELSQHPNIAGFKDSSGLLAIMEESLPQLRPDFSYLLGAAGLLFPGLMLGASGGILTISGIATDLCVKLYNLVLQKRWDEARALQLALIPLNKAVIQTYGVSAAKYALDLLGFYGGPCRLPLLPLSEEGRKAVQVILKNLDLL